MTGIQPENPGDDGPQPDPTPDQEQESRQPEPEPTDEPGQDHTAGEEQSETFALPHQDAGRTADTGEQDAQSGDDNE